MYALRENQEAANTKDNRSRYPQQCYKYTQERQNMVCITKPLSCNISQLGAKFAYPNETVLFYIPSLASASTLVVLWSDGNGFWEIVVEVSGFFLGKSLSCDYFEND